MRSLLGVLILNAFKEMNELLNFFALRVDGNNDNTKNIQNGFENVSNIFNQ